MLFSLTAYVSQKQGPQGTQKVKQVAFSHDAMSFQASGEAYAQKQRQEKRNQRINNFQRIAKFFSCGRNQYYQLV